MWQWSIFQHITDFFTFMFIFLKDFVNDIIVYVYHVIKTQRGGYPYLHLYVTYVLIILYIALCPNDSIFNAIYFNIALLKGYLNVEITLITNHRTFLLSKRGFSQNKRLTTCVRNQVHYITNKPIDYRYIKNTIQDLPSTV